jgi:hypothetical protein
MRVASSPGVGSSALTGIDSREGRYTEAIPGRSVVRPRVARTAGLRGRGILAAALVGIRGVADAWRILSPLIELYYWPGHATLCKSGQRSTIDLRGGHH